MWKFVLSCNKVSNSSIACNKVDRLIACSLFRVGSIALSSKIIQDQGWQNGTLMQDQGWEHCTLIKDQGPFTCLQRDKDTCLLRIGSAARSLMHSSIEPSTSCSKVRSLLVSHSKVTSLPLSHKKVTSLVLSHNKVTKFKVTFNGRQSFSGAFLCSPLFIAVIVAGDPLPVFPLSCRRQHDTVSAEGMSSATDYSTCCVLHFKSLCCLAGVGKKQLQRVHTG